MRDLVIIGAGPGGFDTALKAKEEGLDVVLIEKHIVGGTCLNYGCIPTKALYHNAKTIKDIKKISDFGITVSNYTVDYEAIKVRKETIVSSQVNNIITSLKRNHIDLIEGEAIIVDPATVSVNGEIIKTKNIIIATGSKPRKIPFVGDDLPIIKTSKEILSLDVFPKRMVVVGAGVIGSEMASIFNQFDCEVTLVEYMDDILPPLDKDVKKRARNLYKRQGLTILTNASLNEVVHENDTYKCIIEHKNKVVEVETDYVLVATGRTPHFGNLSLDQLGIEYSNKGIVVNENKETNINHIYAIGDCNGEFMLAHKATYDGYKVLSHIMNKPMSIHFDLVPSVVFTFPEIASVGKTEQQLEGTVYRKNKFMFKTNAKAQCLNETDGFVKMLVDENDTIVGCHIIGPHASDMIHEAVALMNRHLNVEECKTIIHAHPTISEVLSECIKGL